MRRDAPPRKLDVYEVLRRLEADDLTRQQRRAALQTRLFDWALDFAGANDKEGFLRVLEGVLDRLRPGLEDLE